MLPELPQIAPFLNAALNDILTPKHVSVIDVRVEQVSGKSSFNATIFRLFPIYTAADPSLPRTLIAKLPTANQDLHGRALIFQPGSRENWFYRVGRSNSPINVPICYYNEIDSRTQQSILLLEDLTHFPTGNWLDGATSLQTNIALDSLARLHASWWKESSRAEIQELSRLLSPNWPQEQTLVQQLFNAAWPRFVNQFPASLPQAVQSFGESIVDNMAAIDNLIAQAPKTLVHGDFRLDNIHFSTLNQETTCWVIDWEDVFFGSGMVDVSWFLGGCLPIKRSEDEISYLQAYYQTLVNEGAKDYSWEQCIFDYRCAMCSSFVQGILSAAIDAEVSVYEKKLATVIGERFVQAASRLRLWELVS